LDQAKERIQDNAHQTKMGLKAMLLQSFGSKPDVLSTRPATEEELRHLEENEFFAEYSTPWV